jgi:hypothetical protein
MIYTVLLLVDGTYPFETRRKTKNELTVQNIVISCNIIGIFCRMTQGKIQQVLVFPKMLGIAVQP